MDAGKLIGEGSKTCIFQPNLPCINSDIDISDDKVSKVFLTNKVTHNLDEEISFNKKISKLPKSDKWAVTLFNRCNVGNYAEILKIEKDIKKCLENQKISINDFNKNKIMLYGLYGGIDMYDHVDKFFNNFDAKIIFDFFKKTHSLFYGLHIMNKNNILHYDIKGGNMVYSDNKYKYIDFGISTTFDNISKIKKRALKEYNTNRIYEYYPYELFYVFINKNNISKELRKKPFANRKHHEHLEYIHNVAFNRNINNEIMENIKAIKNNKIKRTKVIKSIDIYSLGITLINILIDRINKYSYVENINENKKIINKILYHPTLLPITKLLKRMTEISCNQRIEPYDALKELENILNYNPKY